MKIKPINGSFFFRKGLIPILMRAFIFLYCTAVFSFTSENAFSQNAKIFVDVDKTISVDGIFEMIKKQTDYRFIYKSNLFKDSPAVYLKKGTIRINRLLEQSLSTGDFKIIFTDDNTILIKERALISQVSLVQQTIRGRVTDAKGVPLPGATVSVKNKLLGTSSDLDGNYSIIVGRGDVLIFSFLGFISQEITIDGQAIQNVMLKESTSKLDEVVIVSTGYQNISKERATGSFSTIDEKVLENKISQNFLSKIEGEVSGLLFDNRDGPTIRGISTINANNDPLIVVDGFPISMGLNSINPNDIEKITILKDAAAASIWGVRAANGVIVVVTKKGTKNRKPTIEISTNFSFQPKDNYNDFKLGSTSSLLDFEKHTAFNDWGRLPSGTNQPPLGKAFETYIKLNKGLISQQQADAIINNLKNINSKDQFSDLFMADNIWTQQNLSLTGGGENNTYRASLTHNSNANQNFFKNNDRENIIANIKNSIQIVPKITFRSDFSYNTSTTKNNGMNQANYLGLDRYQEILDKNGDYIIQPRGLDQAYKNSKVAGGYPYNWDYNLQQDFEDKNNESVETLMRIQTGLKYDVTNYLSLEGMYQYEWGQVNTVNLFNENTYYVRDLVNTFTTLDAVTKKLVSPIPKGEVVEKQFAHNDSHSARFQFNFDKKFNDGLHQINSIGGYEVRQDRSDFTSTRKFGYDSQSMSFANIAYGQRFNVVPSGTRVFNDPSSFRESENRFISYYGNLAYTYNKKYTLSGSVRLDDANLFGASKVYRNIPLYSIGGLWDITKENFFNTDGILNKLALRGTYGSNGNVAYGTSPYLQATISRDGNTNNLYAYISDVKNNALRLEKTFVTNVGLDFGLFKSRFDGSIEFYKRKSIDLLAPVSFSSTLGFNKALINAGEMENTGFDLNLNVKVVDGADFKYRTTINLSYNKNVVTEVDVPQQTINTYLFGEPLKGKPLRYLYSYQNAGLDAKGDPLHYNEKGELINVDGKKSDGTNGALTSPEALDYNGTITPKYYGAWINNLNYKKFSLRALTTFKAGHVFRNTDILAYQDLRSVTGNRQVHADFDNRWLKPGDEANTNIPRIPTKFNDGGKIGYTYYKSGNQFVDDASHIRLKEIVLGYQLDPKFLTEIGINRLGISLQATNIAVFNFNKWDIDPESIFLPVKPTYSFNLTVNF